MTLDIFPADNISPDFSWAKNTDTVFWDMDLVLYEPCHKFIRTCWKSSYRTAMELIPGLNAKQAIGLAQQSWEKHHSGYDFIFKDYNIDPNEVLHVWHKNLDESFIKPASNEFLEKIQQSAKKHILITHGSRSWSNRVLKQANVKDFFPDKHIISIEDMYPYKKSTHTEPYSMALDIAGCNPENTPMIEDTQFNLQKAKELSLKTAAVYQKPNAIQQAYTDYMLQTPEMFLEQIIEAKNNLTLKL